MAQKLASFTTFVAGRAHTCGVVLDCREDDRAPLPGDFARVAGGPTHANARAFGKIAVVMRDGIAVYQSSADSEAASVFCGNATAAAFRFLSTDGAPTKTVRNGSVGYDVAARIDGDSVGQVWLVPPASVEQMIWRGLRVLRISTLNPYALIVGNLPKETTAEQARSELVGATAASKLAVISKGTIEFYNANGRHGAAPQTGLASLALAARAIPWFAELLLGMPSLPPIAPRKDGRLAITMPAVTIELCELALPQAA